MDRRPQLSGGHIYIFLIFSFGVAIFLKSCGSWYLSGTHTFGILGPWELSCFLFYLYLLFFYPLDNGSPLLGQQDLKDFVRSAGEVTYADVDREGKGYAPTLHTLQTGY